MCQNVYTNCLDTLRQEVKLPQSIAAFLLGSGKATRLPQYEKGVELPDLSMLISLNLLYDTPIIRIYKKLHGFIKEKLIKRLGMLITEYTLEKDKERYEGILTSLRSVLRRLTNKKCNV